MGEPFCLLQGNMWSRTDVLTDVKRCYAGYSLAMHGFKPKLSMSEPWTSWTKLRESWTLQTSIANWNTGTYTLNSHTINFNKGVRKLKFVIQTVLQTISHVRTFSIAFSMNERPSGSWICLIQWRWQLTVEPSTAPRTYCTALRQPEATFISRNVFYWEYNAWKLDR